MSDSVVNKQRLQDVYRRWHESRGQCLDEFIDLFADDVRWGSLAAGTEPAAFTAHRTGKDEMRRYFDGLLAGWTMNYYKVDHLVAEGDRVVMVGATSWTNKATGKTCDTPKVDVWRFEDDRAVEFHEYYDTAKLFAAAT